MQQCGVNELLDVYVWGKHFLDITDAKQIMIFGHEKYTDINVRTQNVIDLLSVDWIDNFISPKFVRILHT